VQVLQAGVRELEYHAEILELLRLEGQLDRDAVIVVHMGYPPPPCFWLGN